MECLYCGFCCKGYNPFGDFPQCRYLVQPKDTFYLCSIYEKRPEVCKKHTFDHRFCPCGMSVLKDKFRHADDISIRIDTGYEFGKRKADQ